MIKPLISVIVPCYNSEKWIDKCIDKIINQTYKNIEIVCVDDCSTDNTADRLKDLSKTNDRIRVIFNKDNLGPGVSRNIAIKNARGEYLCFCDSDDWYDLDYIENMFFCINQYKADIAMANYKKIIESSGEVIEVNYISGEKGLISINDALVCSKASLCLLMLKKDIFDNIEIPDLRNGEDMAIIPVLISRAKQICLNPACYYNYLIRGTSSSNRISKNVYKSLLLSYDFLNKNISNYFEEKEYIGIRNVLYGSILNAIKAKINKKIVKDIIINFCSEHPRWKKNIYYKQNMTIAKRLFVFFATHNLFVLARLLAKIHEKKSV